jgi:hypothetical protein
MRTWDFEPEEISGRDEVVVWSRVVLLASLGLISIDQLV